MKSPCSVTLGSSKLNVSATVDLILGTISAYPSLLLKSTFQEWLEMMFLGAVETGQFMPEHSDFPLRDLLQCQEHGSQQCLELTNVQDKDLSLQPAYSHCISYRWVQSVKQTYIWVASMRRWSHSMCIQSHHHTAPST